MEKNWIQCWSLMEGENYRPNGVRVLENMVMGSMGLKTKNDCTGKGQQQFTQLVRPLEKCTKH
jgi:hypothetical protein